MQEYMIIIAGLFILATISGMLGLGVAFSAIPFLGLFMEDLVHQVHPLSLLLNGATALLATLGFARSGFVDWRKAIPLAVVTTVSAPVGSLLVQYVDQRYVWVVYFCAILYLAYRLFKAPKGGVREPNFKLAMLVAVPISALAGFLGVGPGFLLMPALIIIGFDPKEAAGINAFAVTPPSFSALIPHLATAHWNTSLTISLVVAGSLGAFIGARLTSLYLPGNRLRQAFGILIIIMTAYKIYTFLG